MKKIVILACFIGKAPNYFGMWLKSAAANPSIDFYLVGEMSNLDEFELPPNFYVKHYTLKELENVVRTKLNVPDACISIPYKTGDYRPMFGEMFSDWLGDYDVWGTCDVDVVFGDLRVFLTEEKLEQYDKIYPLGHLSLYKNTPEVNARWRLPDARYDVHLVMTSPEVYAFDEWRGIHNIYMRRNFPFYRTVEFASPAPRTHRYFFKDRSNPKYEKNPKNYDDMCFYWEDGHVYRAYNAGTRRHPDIRRDEFAYMHFYQRRFPTPEAAVLKAKAFYCSPQGFFVKETDGLPTMKDIRFYNPYPFGGIFGEKLLCMKSRLVEWGDRTLDRWFHRKTTFASREQQITENRKW